MMATPLSARSDWFFKIDFFYSKEIVILKFNYLLEQFTTKHSVARSGIL